MAAKDGKKAVDEVARQVRGSDDADIGMHWRVAWMTIPPQRNVFVITKSRKASELE